MGQIQLQGIQDGLPGTPSVPVGPFSVSTSLAVFNVQWPLTTGSNVLDLPDAPAGNGLLVVAPVGNAQTLQFGGLNIGLVGLVLVWVFDQNNLPTSLTLSAGGSVTVTVQGF